MPRLGSFPRILVLVCLLTPVAEITLWAQIPPLTEVMRDFNSGQLDLPRLRYWADKFGTQQPSAWQLTPTEYVGAVLSLSARLTEQGQQVTQLLVNAARQVESDSGPSSPDLLPLLDELASVYDAKQQFEQAVLVERRALGIAQSAAGYYHPSLAGRLRHLFCSSLRWASSDRSSALEFSQS
jgi:hypothetical protein